MLGEGVLATGCPWKAALHTGTEAGYWEECSRVEQTVREQASKEPRFSTEASMKFMASALWATSERGHRILRVPFTRHPFHLAAHSYYSPYFTYPETVPRYAE